MRGLVLLPLLLSGCLFHASGVPAPPNALSCAEQAATGMGYSITARSENASFRAEKRTPGTGVYREVSELSVAFWTDPGQGARLRVDGARYEERQAGGTSLPGRPGFGGQPGTPTAGMPGTGVQVGSRGQGRHRISPGQAAVDAAAIEKQCAAGPRTHMALR